MKKFLAMAAALCLLLTGCASESGESGKITVIATLFPQYDFARQIAGDRASVTLLLPAGQESHLYDPTPADMTAISKADIFVYTGDNMESWASDLASSVGDKVKIVDASEGISLYESSGDHDLDPHIWLDFDNAKKMAENVFNALVEISPENTDYFTENLHALEDSLTSLDEEYRAAFSASDKTLVFGGRFALGYLLRRCGADYISAYDSCGAEAEPGVQDIKRLYDYVKENNVKAVYAEEFSEPKVARTIAEANGAEVLLLHSAENTSREEREEGVTFVSLMEKNLEKIRKGL